MDRKNDSNLRSTAIANARHAALVSAKQLGFGVGAQDATSGCILGVNPTFAGLLGRTLDDMQTMLVPELFDDTNRRVYVEQMEERTRGQQAPYRIEMLTRGGGRVKMLVVPSPVFIGGTLVAEVAAMLPAGHATEEALAAARSFVKSQARMSTRTTLPRAPHGARPRLVSDRECACLHAARAGCARSQIAEALSISVRTVHEHLRASARKLGLPNAKHLLHSDPCALCGRSDCNRAERIGRWSCAPLEP